MNVRATNLVIDCNDLDRMTRFWAELLDHDVAEQSSEWVDLGPLGDGGPVFSLQRVPESKVAKNRLHLDLVVGDAAAHGERARRLGARPASPPQSGSAGPWQVWRDPEGNEFCLITG
jgi:hypothetical protein